MVFHDAEGAEGESSLDNLDGLVFERCFDLLFTDGAEWSGDDFPEYEVFAEVAKVVLCPA